MVMSVDIQHVIIRALEQYRVYLAAKQKEHTTVFSSSVLNSEEMRVEQAIEQVSMGLKSQQEKIAYVQQELDGLKKQSRKTIRGVTPDLQTIEVHYDVSHGFILTIHQQEILTTFKSRLVAKIFTSLML